jgi:hypothetical protein
VEGAMKRAKTNGVLNLQGRDLKAFPMDICKFEELKIIENWWESFDLTKIDLSNNEIPEVPDDIATQEFV